jgi:hypothetical protein
MKLRPGILHRSGGGGGGGGGGIAPSFVGLLDADASIGDANLLVLASQVQVNDLLLLLCENAGDDAALVAPAGFASVSGSPIADGVSSSGSRLNVFWRRVIPADLSLGFFSVNVDNPDDHIAAVLVGFRNIKTTGNPWNVTATSVAGSAVTAITITGLTTTLDNCMVVSIASTGRDVSSSTEFTGWTNASLASITEGADFVENSGNGEGIGMAYGIKTVAGLVGSTTATTVGADRHAYMMIALAPAS